MLGDICFVYCCFCGCRHVKKSRPDSYIYVNASVKNESQQDIDCDEIYSVTADYNNGYKYTGFNVITDSDGDFNYANINTVTPLQTMGVHCLTECPEEVEKSDNPLTLTFKLRGGKELLYTVR